MGSVDSTYRPQVRVDLGVDQAGAALYLATHMWQKARAHLDEVKASPRKRAHARQRAATKLDLAYSAWSDAYRNWINAYHDCYGRR